MTRSPAHQAVQDGSSPAPLRQALGITQAVAPGAAAWVSERLFFTPARRRATPEAEALFRGADRFTLRVEGRGVRGWHWGQGPLVYLMHGWSSAAGRLAGFVAPLVDAGLSVVAFDAPGHGASGRGMSSMPEFARALLAVTATFGAPHGIVGHSMGAAASGLAVRWGLRPRRLVFLAPPANPADYAAPFARALGLRPDTVSRLKARSERRLRFRWTDLDVCRMAPAERVPLLVVHDRDDATVPFTDGEAIARSWDGRLRATEGLGHGGVLRDPGVVAEAVDFVTDGAGPPPAADAATRLEWAMFHREARW
jgi:pimeloyl-ACP methyl ester carboxylesterase